MQKQGSPSLLQCKSATVGQENVRCAEVAEMATPLPTRPVPTAPATQTDQLPPAIGEVVERVRKEFTKGVRNILRHQIVHVGYHTVRIERGDGKRENATVCGRNQYPARFDTKTSVGDGVSSNSKFAEQLDSEASKDKVEKF